MSKEETIEHLFRMHYGAMFRLAVAMLHDADEAKDAVSEVFARLFRGNVRLPEKGTDSYLLASVRNQCLDIIRQKQIPSLTYRSYSTGRIATWHYWPLQTAG